MYTIYVMKKNIVLCKKYLFDQIQIPITGQSQIGSGPESILASWYQCRTECSFLNVISHPASLPRPAGLPRPLSLSHESIWLNPVQFSLYKLDLMSPFPPMSSVISGKQLWAKWHSSAQLMLFCQHQGFLSQGKAKLYYIVEGPAKWPTLKQC